MTVDFRDYFWGEKNNGFDVLYQNMKFGYGSSKELADFIRERSTIEEYNSKLFAKLAKQSGNCSTNGTFAPLWQILKSSTEKLSSLHMQMVHRFQELVKDIHKYCDEQHKKHKQVKTEESATIEVVGDLKDTASSLLKAKELYNAKFLEFERLKRDNSSPKDIERAEAKLRKSCDDYKALIAKYSSIKEDFEKKMSVSCQHFQLVEEAHINQMKNFISSYVQVLESSHALIGQVNSEIRNQCTDLDFDKLLDQFVKAKATGSIRPVSLSFEEADVSSLDPYNNGDSPELNNGEKNKREGNNFNDSRMKSYRRTTSLLDLFRGSSGGSVKGNVTGSGFLKSKREKRRDKRRKKKNEVIANKEDNISIEAKDNSSTEPSQTEPHVDEEGYIIRATGSDKKSDIDNFYSSSDCDSDENEKKFHFEIKPVLNNGGASVAELRETVKSLSISPSLQQTRRHPDALHLRMKRRPVAVSSNTSTPDDGQPLKRSTSQHIYKTDSDLLSVFSSSASNVSTPNSAAGQVNQINTVSIDTPSQNYAGEDRYAALSALFSDSNKNDSGFKAGNLSKSMSSSSVMGPPLSTIPRPISKRTQQPPSSHLSQQNNMSRCESYGSLSSDFRMTPVSVGSSRGPSPLTIGIGDVVPLAVALQESISARFKGVDESKCQIQVFGSLKIAFPSGIIMALTNNPSPAVLTFRLTNAARLDRIHPNKDILMVDTKSLKTMEYAFEINMPSLIILLKKMFEQTPNARYYNVDILKYQLKPCFGAKFSPLQIVSHWRCDSQSARLRIDYKYNPSALSSIESLKNVSFTVNMEGNVQDMQTEPEALWNHSNNQAIWKFDQISRLSEGNGIGSLKAKFDMTRGPCSPGFINMHFSCVDATTSGIEFELTCAGYRVSLVKKQISAGHYICEVD